MDKRKSSTIEDKSVNVNKLKFVIRCPDKVQFSYLNYDSERDLQNKRKLALLK